jgi:cation diffusion facilitator CzcD-associated flavoprotein CzcO
MKQAGIHTFTIYESSLGIGGTGFNTYPGAEVDVGSHLYCYSFKLPTDPHAPRSPSCRSTRRRRSTIRPPAAPAARCRREAATWDDDRHGLDGPA